MFLLRNHFDVHQFDGRLIDVDSTKKDSESRQLGEISFPHGAPKRGQGELALAGDSDKSCGFKFLEVVRKGGRGDGATLAKFDARAVFPSGNVLQDVVTLRIGDGLGNRAQLARGLEAWTRCEAYELS